MRYHMGSGWGVQPMEKVKVGIITMAPWSSVTTAMMAAAVAPNVTSGTEPS